MADTHSWTLQVKPSGLPSLPADQPTVVTGQYSIDVDDTVLAGQTSQVFAGSITAAKIISYVIHSSQVAATVNTNSISGAGGQSFALGAAKAQGWNNVMPNINNPITTDITGIWVVNADTKDTVFRASFLMML